MYYVYKITNKVNGKLYIGKSIDATKRFRAHKRISKYPNSPKFKAIHAAIRKYGETNFEITVIDFDESEEIAYKLENRWVVQFRQDGYTLYNQDDGGVGGIGRPCSLETRAKLSKASMGKPKTEQHKQAMRAPKSNTDNMGHQGSDNPFAKLNETIVKEIKLLLRDTKLKQREIGKMFGVKQTVISNIKVGKAWSHVQL